LHHPALLECDARTSCALLDGQMQERKKDTEMTWKNGNWDQSEVYLLGCDKDSLVVNIEGSCRYAAYLLELGKEYMGLPKVRSSFSIGSEIKKMGGVKASDQRPPVHHDELSHPITIFLYA